MTELILSAALFLAMEIFLYLYLDSPRRGSLFWKACAALMPVLLCLSGALRSGGDRWLLLAAVTVCLISDVLIGIHFVSGVLSFLTAHVLLIVYLLLQSPPTPWSLLPWAVLYGSMWLYYGKEIPTLGKKAVPMCLYPAFLFGMFSLALALPFLRPGPSSVCLALGAACFCVSDLVLGDGVVHGKETRLRDHVIMHLYEPAVFLLALSTVW